MPRIVIPIFEGQIATVCDFARSLQVVEVSNGSTQVIATLSCCDAEAQSRAKQIRDTGATVLICGALSVHLARALAHSGLRVISEVTGSVQSVVQAFAAGTLHQPQFRLPCCRRRQYEQQKKPLSQEQESFMLVAFSTQSASIDAPLDPRFGRAKHFVVTDSLCAKSSTYDNPHGGDTNHGAGIRTAEFIANLGVEVVVSGAVGPKAMDVLRQAGIRAFACPGGTAAEALARLNKGELQEIT
jgi:predicted Fe-Mo cluster-binding NifX family protein